MMMIMMMMMMQIEREHEEHLLPRLASSPQSDVPDASVIHIRSDTPDSQSSEHDLVIDQKPPATSLSSASKAVAMPIIHPAPEPVSPEPVSTRSSRVAARSPEPTFISIPAVTTASVAPPAMVPVPMMVPAPVPAPSVVSNDSITRPSLPASEPTPTVQEKPKSNFAVLKSGESVFYVHCGA